MGFHGGGWWSYIRYDEERDRPEVSRSLLRRVAGYARPYWVQAVLLIALIIVTSLLSLIPPLLYRALIDDALPNGDVELLNLIAIGIIGIAVLVGIIEVAQRYFSSTIGEGIIYDLRRGLYAHMQTMSLRFFTNTRTGEMMSRLNNDVIGAQRAVTGTIVSIVTNLITLVTHACHHALVGVAADAAQHRHSAPLYPASAAGGARAAPHRATEHGVQRRDERHDERDAQRQRRAPGQDLWPRR